jgi:deoxyribonuclease V
MKAALDVHYGKGLACAACVVFDYWRDAGPRDLVCLTLPGGQAYCPGMFYERELPCLLAVLGEAGHEFETIIVDGYVHLRAGRGLGAHLHEALPYPAAVIGVAKSPLEMACSFVRVCRGKSARPLYVSAVGCRADQAGAWISEMHGPFRIPTLLRLADRLARGGCTRT